MTRLLTVVVLAVFVVGSAVGLRQVAAAESGIPPASRSTMRGLIAYTSRSGDLWVMRADGTRRHRVTRARGKVDFDPDFSPDGKQLVFRSERGRQPPDPYGVGYDALFVVRTDGTQLRQINPPSGGLFPAWSPNGDLIAFSGSATGNPSQDNITLMTPRGTAVRDLGVQGEGAVWSPDGSRVAFASHTGDGNWAVWVINADGGNPRQLTFPRLTQPAGANGDAPGAWSRDGQRVVYSSVVRGDREVYVMNADGSGKRRVTRLRGPDSPNAWLPDGRILFAHSTGGPIPRWYVVRPDGTRLRSLPWLNGAADPIGWWTWQP
jgi:Tol biopolymer transport system component